MTRSVTKQPSNIEPISPGVTSVFVLQVGLAEAAVAMAKLAARQGDSAAAGTHLAAALGHYSKY